jgi:hypothetical protein
MIRAEQALEEILLVFIDEEEPQEVLRLNAEALIEKFKADTSASYQALANTDDIVANELAKLRDALDREIERRPSAVTRKLPRPPITVLSYDILSPGTISRTGWQLKATSGCADRRSSSNRRA